MREKNSIAFSSSKFWNGLYLFKLGLYALGYINFSILLNLLVFIGLCIRFNNKIVQRIYGFVIGTIALMLFYSDSFLPSIDQMIAQKDNLTGFSTSYILELCISFINFKMVFAFIFAIVCLSVIKKYIRVQSIIIILIVLTNFLNIGRIRDGLSYDPTLKVTKVSNEAGDMIATLTQAGMDKYLNDFYQDQAESVLKIYDNSNATVDVVIVHADGMSNDDLSAFSNGHSEILGRFNIFLTKFNSVSTDATVNTTRLLNSMCGQRPALELSKMEKRCNLVNDLGALNFIKRGFFDNKKLYFTFENNFSENYINDNDKLTDYDKVSDIFNQCIKNLNTQDLKSKSINYISISTLHNQNDFTKYHTNVTKFLMHLNNFMDNLQHLNRNVLLVFVPAKGDLVQNRFDIIPTRKVLEASVMIKFISGTKTYETIVFDKNTSYQAVADLILKSLKGEYLNDKRFFSVKAFVEDTKTTDFVGEDKQYDYIEPFNKHYFKAKDANWIELTK